MELDWDAIRGAVNSRVKNTRCPSCQQSEGWTGGTTLARLPVIAEDPQANGKTRDPEAQPSIMVVSISCAKCGYIHMYDVHTVLGH